jgi:hypothetical protein
VSFRSSIGSGEQPWRGSGDGRGNRTSVSDMASNDGLPTVVGLLRIRKGELTPGLAPGRPKNLQETNG